MIRFWNTRSIRFRLTLWYGGMLAVLLLANGAGVWAWARHDAVAEVDRELDDDFDEVVAHADRDEDGNFLLPIDLDDSDPADLPLIEIRDAAGAPQLRLPPDRSPASDDGAWVDTGRAAITVPLADGTRARVRRAEVELGGAPFVLEVGRSLVSVDQELAELRLILASCIAVGVAAAALAGWLLAGRALAPVERLTTQARHITAERLAERLPMPNPDDELGRLAAAFNDMLQRLDRSFEQLRRFTADASHELRTPLTALRLVGENALRIEGMPAEARDVIGSMLEEVDRLARLVDDLLQLARADAGQAGPKLESCDLAALARDVTEQLGVLAEEKHLALRVAADGPAPVRGNPMLLRQALQNLVDNAIRHGPTGSEVSVSVGCAGDRVTAEIADHGPGIPIEHRERVFERFFRLDAARSRRHGGAGLGLAITRWIVDAHRGRVEVIATNGTAPGSEPGATFRIELPAQAPASTVAAPPTATKHPISTPKK